MSPHTGAIAKGKMASFKYTRGSTTAVIYPPSPPVLREPWAAVWSCILEKSYASTNNYISAVL